jgi:gamma-glutamylputrescine oxidase
VELDQERQVTLHRQFAAGDNWYAADTAALDLPVLRGDHRADVCVVGAGLTGLSAAVELAERGYRVIVLEAQTVAAQASGRSGGHALRGFQSGMDKVEDLAGAEQARALWQLSVEARELIDQRIARHAIECDFRPGYLIAALSDEDHDEQRRELETFARYGERVELLDRERTAALVASPRYVGGLLQPSGGRLHPLKYSLGVARAAQAAGAQLYGNSPVSELEQHGGATRLRLGDACVTASFVVLAAGVYGAELAPQLETHSMRAFTYMVATAPLGARAKALLPSNIAVEDTYYSLNYYHLSHDDRLLFGSGFSYAPWSVAHIKRRDRAVMRWLFPQLDDVEVEFGWRGPVDVTRTRMPDLGRIAPNVFYAHGFSGHGIALTGLAGRLMAEAVAGTAERFDVFARLPLRSFPRSRLLRRAALETRMAYWHAIQLLQNVRAAAKK